MALTHSTAAKQAATDAVVDLIDLGTGTATGILKIKAGATVLATLPMSNPAFGSAATSGIATASAITDDSSADATGTADSFDIVDRDGAVVVSGSVTATGGGGDIELDSVNITAGQTVSMTSLTYQGETP